MPPVTSDEAICGFSGLAVVFARLKAREPVTAMAAPKSTSASAKNIRSAGDTNSRAAAGAAIHMQTASVAATMGGGMSVLSERMGEREP